jgi:hypothetical protein
MVIDFKAIIDTETIQVKVPVAHMDDKLLNLVAYDTEMKIPLEFGVSEAELQRDIPAEWEKVKDITGFETLFAIETPKYDFENFFFEYYRTNIFVKTRRLLRKFGWFFADFDWYDYDLWIQNYKQWPAERCQKFEYMLQINQKARKLSINGAPREIPLWRRRLEKWIRWLLTGCCPAVLFIGLLFVWGIIAGIDEKWLPLFVIIIILPLLAWFVGTVVWMISMRKLVPVSYLRLFVPEFTLQYVTEKLAAVLLKDRAVAKRPSA